MKQGSTIENENISLEVNHGNITFAFLNVKNSSCIQVNADSNKSYTPLELICKRKNNNKQAMLKPPPFVM